jgi:uncharacterized protein
MLIEFSVGNYRSFKERVTVSMVAANLVSKDKSLDANNVFAIDEDLSLLKSAAIYGANASGKSNLAQALGFVRWFVNNSSKETQSTEKIRIDRFKLSTETEATPTFFEIVFLMNRVKYRYGFKVTRDEVISEWLFYVPKSRETRLFDRKLDQFTISKAYKANGIQQRTRRNALFLSVSAQFNVAIAESILEWMASRLRVVSGLDSEGFRDYTIRCIINNQNKGEILQLLRKLDLGFSDITAEEIEITTDFSEMPTEVRKFFKDTSIKSSLVQTVHQKFDQEGKSVSTEVFDFDSQESEGTQKVFAFSALLVETLKNGNVLVLDEFDASIHPLISRAIVNLFNSSETNPNNAQLIFMTHDTNLLSNKTFRRDQIWFVEKDRYGATDLYSLAEYKVRSDASFESDYIKGKYGAIPYVGNLSHLINAHG